MGLTLFCCTAKLIRLYMYVYINCYIYVLLFHHMISKPLCTPQNIYIAQNREWCGRQAIPFISRKLSEAFLRMHVWVVQK